jgi:hypothetical protein
MPRPLSSTRSTASSLSTARETPILGSALAEHRGGAPNEVAKVDGAFVEHNFSGDDAANIEKIIDQPRQVVSLSSDD